MTITLPGQIIKMDTESGIDPVWYGKLGVLFDQVNTLTGIVPSGAAWTVFTPTVTAASGTFTTVIATGSWQRIGKMVSFIATMTISSVGTASGNIFMSLPVGTLARAFATCGVETNLTGKTVNAFGATGASTLTLNQGNASGASLAIGGYVLTISGTYEAT